MALNLWKYPKRMAPITRLLTVNRFITSVKLTIRNAEWTIRQNSDA